MFSLTFDVKEYLITIIILCYSALIFGQPKEQIDSCGVNDSCEKAILIPNVISDFPFVCFSGCNLNARPAPFNNSCGIGNFPTVWFKVPTDGTATLINIHVQSEEIDAPAISLFQFVTNCSNLRPIPLTQSNLSCIVGSNGVAEAIGSTVGASEDYYIAVSSKDSVGGHFTICVNTISLSSVCVLDANIEITARSDGGALTGPFFPGEIISVCLNVNSYTAVGNGCQWFQGLIPRFGNGWDPSSFDANGQPLNATINGNNFGVQENGLYGAATWDWFTDIGYHHTYTAYQIGDFDHNGTIELCSDLYEVDCPDLGGITGGCCGPCWAEPGDPLPPGWFAYGINGTCPTPGPPPTVDWGDGNTCGGGMGPWHFCFDLKVRNYPDCLEDANSDLTIGFITTSDGETGSWTGGPSSCQYDQPLKLSIPLACVIETDLGTEFVPDLCAGEEFNYEISETGISHWTWGIDPSYAVIDSIHEADNGYLIESELFNPSNHTLTVTYTFHGQVEGSQNTVIKKVKFNILTPVTISLVDQIIVCEDATDSIVINSFPITGGGGPPYAYLWNTGDSTAKIIIEPRFHNMNYELMVTDKNGCTVMDQVVLNVKPCLFDTIKPYDESNDEPKKEDTIVGGGNVVCQHIEKRSMNNPDEEKIKIYPVPATDFIFIEWPVDINEKETLTFIDPSGNILLAANVTEPEMQAHRKKINIGYLANGVYVVNFLSSKGVFTSRMVKI